MRFEPVHFPEKLEIINPKATLAVVTLWSKTDFILGKLERAGVDLSPDTSPLAVIGKLHGEGVRYLLRNLLNNPQIDTLLVFGSDMSGSYRYLLNFFEQGVEPAAVDLEYRPIDGNRPRPVRIKGTDHIMDSLVSPGLFKEPPAIERIEGVNRPATKEAARFINQYRSQNRQGSRLNVPVPEVEIVHYPSNPRAHTILAGSPSQAWKRLVHRVYRFGKPVLLRKGRRIELQNVKVIVEKPAFEEDRVIRECGFSPDDFQIYQEHILSPEAAPDQPYTYGHRLRSYFGIDTLSLAADKMKHSLDDRDAYITTWDNREDLTNSSHPCLVSLFFRKIESRLFLTATYRTHNTSNAWLENLYGLMAIQRYAADRAGLSPAAITVISHSITLDPAYMEKIKAVYDEVSRHGGMENDPSGYFLITTDGNDIVLEHWHNSVRIGEYRHENPLVLQQRIYRDLAVSDLNHAMYLGRQLEKAHQCIVRGELYEQDV